PIPPLPHFNRPSGREIREKQWRHILRTSTSKNEALHCADSRQLQHLSFAPFNFHKARVRRASGFLLTAFSTACPNLLFRSTLLTKGAPPKQHYRHSPTINSALQTGIP